MAAVSDFGMFQMGKVFLTPGITTQAAVLDDATALQPFAATSLTDRHGRCVVVSCCGQGSIAR